MMIPPLPCWLGRTAWTGNDKVGQGSMTLVESKSGEFVRINVEFVKPFEGKSTSEFTFRPQGDRTQVTWTLAYERALDPAWYFGPWERYATRLAAGYLIDAVARP